MAFKSSINRFNFGEVSPLLCARGDLAKYSSGCKTLLNFIPLLQGPVRRRGGTRFVAKAANSGRPVLLLKFVFSETTTYILEAGDGYMRFYCLGQPVLEGQGPYQISTPWAQKDLFLKNGISAIKYVQSGDVMYIVCPGQPPQKLCRYGHTDWRIIALANWARDEGDSRAQARPNPTAIALFQERLCFAAGQTIFMSQSGAFENFKLTEAVKDNSGNITVPIASDDPIEINVYSEQMDKIEWLCPSGSLLVGTTGGEFVIGETTSVDPLGPENIKVSAETAFGSSPIQALRIGSVVMFAQRAGRKLREFVYDYSGDGYSALDVTVAAEHITKGGLCALAWQSEPIETLWAVRADGQLLGFTYCREQDMAAWHRHQLGGRGRVSQVAVVPAVHGGQDELWMSVARSANGENVYFIEIMNQGFEREWKQDEAFFVDAGLTVRGDKMAEVTGLEHLEGFEVALLADGGLQPGGVVTGGKVKLQYPADTVQVGLAYESVLSTLNLDLQLQDGSAQGRIKRFTKVVLRLVDSCGGLAGRDQGNLAALEYRSGLDAANQALPLFSGDKLINWPGGYDTAGSLTVIQPYPLPFTLAAIIPTVTVSG